MDETDTKPEIDAEDREQISRMVAEVKKQLKPMSKNQLIRLYTATLIDLHITRQAFNQLTSKVNEAAEVINTPQAPEQE